MAQFIVRNLEDEVRDKLRQLAESRGQSMAEVVREILRRAVTAPIEPQPRLGSRLSTRFARLGLNQAIAELRGQEVIPPSLDR